eukprot:1008507-Prymnesium_polylepis.2
MHGGGSNPSGKLLFARSRRKLRSRAPARRADSRSLLHAGGTDARAAAVTVRPPSRTVVLPTIAHAMRPSATSNGNERETRMRARATPRLARAHTSAFSTVAVLVGRYDK